MVVNNGRRSSRVDDQYTLNVARATAGRSAPADLFRCPRCALHRQYRGGGPTVHVNVGNERDAHARWLDDVDAVDANAWTDVALRHSVVPWYVAYHDDRDDAAVVNADVAALPPSGFQDGRQALRSIDFFGGGWVFLRVDCTWVGHIRSGYHTRRS